MAKVNASRALDEAILSPVLGSPSGVRDVEKGSCSNLDAVKPEDPPPSGAATEFDHPHNWSSSRKVSIAILVSLSQLVTLMTASVMAAALPQIAHDLNLSTSTTQIAFSVFMLGLAFGPVPIAALSETYGRRPLWLASNLWYLLWNSLCPVGNSSALMVVGRLLAGFGASVGIALSGPIVADMYGPEERGKSLAVATFAPYLGPALGPIIGGIMAQKASWHWLFWILSIFDAGMVAAALFLLRESYAPVLRHRHLMRSSSAPFESATSPKRPRLNLTRPIMLLWKRPIVQVLAFLTALNFGTYCVTLSTFAVLWIDQYQQTPLISSLHYLAIAIGSTTASQGGGFLTDRIWRWLREKRGGTATPEFRVPLMIPGTVLMPVGLLWYGWSAERQMSWVMVDVGVVVFSVGSFVWAQALQAYLLDEFTQHAASANAASRMLSYCLGFAFPIFAPQLYQKLGYGWGNSLLALIAIVFGWPSPFLLWQFGRRLRSIGRVL